MLAVFNISTLIMSWFQIIKTHIDQKTLNLVNEKMIVHTLILSPASSPNIIEDIISCTTDTTYVSIDDNIVRHHNCTINVEWDDF